MTEYKPYEYQESVLEWLEERENNEIYNIYGGILYLKMGMGKTFISLTNIYRNKGNGPTLIICSKSVLTVWMSEIEKFFGDKLKYDVLHNQFNKNMNKLRREDIMKNDILLTTYDFCVSNDRSTQFSEQYKLIEIKKEKEKHVGFKIKNHETVYNDEDITKKNIIYSIKWERVIVDESQNISNMKSKRFMALYAIPGSKRICLSGTPLRNNIYEIYAQYKFLGMNQVNKFSNWDEKCMNNLNLWNFMKELDYDETNITLPDKNEEIINVEMDEITLAVYKDYLEDYQYDIHKYYDCPFVEDNREPKNPKNPFIKLMKLTTRLRQFSNSLYLMTSNMKNLNEYYNGFLGIDHSKEELKKMTEKYIKLKPNGENDPLYNTFFNQKTQNIAKKIMEIINRNEKVIIFSTSTSYLELLNIYLMEYYYMESIFLRSKDNIAKRQYKINEFKTNDNKNIFILNYKMGSEGLNLTEANNIILVDTWWNRTVEDQAIARSWRNGQTKIVNVYRFITKYSIEEIMEKISSDKNTFMGKLKLGDECLRTSVGENIISKILEFSKDYFENREIDIGLISQKLYDNHNHNKNKVEEMKEPINYKIECKSDDIFDICDDMHNEFKKYIGNDNLKTVCGIRYLNYKTFCTTLSNTRHFINRRPNRIIDINYLKELNIMVKGGRKYKWRKDIINYFSKIKSINNKEIIDFNTIKGDSGTFLSFHFVDDCSEQLKEKMEKEKQNRLREIQKQREIKQNRIQKQREIKQNRIQKQNRLREAIMAYEKQCEIQKQNRLREERMAYEKQREIEIKTKIIRDKMDKRKKKELKNDKIKHYCTAEMTIDSKDENREEKIRKLRIKYFGRK